MAEQTIQSQQNFWKNSFQIMKKLYGPMKDINTLYHLKKTGCVW